MRIIRRLMVYLMLIISVSCFLAGYVVELEDVSGDSMEPVLSGGEVVLADKVSFLLGTLHRFDIIAFDYQYKKDTYYIKRIIGLPGECVKMSGGKIYINGELLVENYALEPMKVRVDFETTLEADEYFVLGDNRNNSSDSRTSDIGNVKLQQIRGRVFARLFPIRKFTFFNVHTEIEKESVYESVRARGSKNSGSKEAIPKTNQ